MKFALPALFVLVLTSSCERPAEAPGGPTNKVEGTSPASGGANAANSIIRPEVAEEVAPLPPPPPPEPLHEVIAFGDSGTALDDLAKAAIDGLLANPRFANGGAITLSGHSDSSGNDADNLAVSRRRAEAVRDYLIAKGIPAERMTVIALGERRPLAPNAHPDGSDHPEGRRRNRRVEITVASPAGPASATPPAVSRKTEQETKMGAASRLPPDS